MKTTYKYIIVVLLLFCEGYSFSQSPPCQLPNPIYITNIPQPSNYIDAELVIYNMTLFRGIERSDTIKVKIIPIGAFYNGFFKYSPKARYEIDTGHSTSISGSEIFIPSQPSINIASRKTGNFDKGGGSCDFSFGYGKYKLEFYRQIEEDSPYVFVNYVYVDFRDAGNNNLPSEYGGTFDIRIDYFSKDTITFQHHPHVDNYSNYYFRYWPIDLVNKNIIMDSLYGSCLTHLTPDKGLFSTDSTNYGEYLK